MAKTGVPPPDDSGMVLTVMRKYVSEKGWYYSDTDLELLAETCFLHFDSLGWKGITFWPSVVKKWVVNDMKYSKRRQGTMPKCLQSAPSPAKHDNETLKQRIQKQLERKRNES